jgi:hypothetical protein
MNTECKVRERSLSWRLTDIFLSKLSPPGWRPGRDARKGTCNNWSNASTPWKPIRSQTYKNASACWKRCSSWTMWRYNENCVKCSMVIRLRLYLLPLPCKHQGIPKECCHIAPRVRAECSRNASGNTGMLLVSGSSGWSMLFADSSIFQGRQRIVVCFTTLCSPLVCGKIVHHS